MNCLQDAKPCRQVATPIAQRLFLTVTGWPFFLDKYALIAILFERYAVRTILALCSLGYQKSSKY